MAAPDELRFQELEEATAAPPDALPPRAPPREGPTAVSVGPEEGDDADTAELLGEQRPPRSFWTFEFYQSFFDVDTQQVLERIKGSVTPLPGKSLVRLRLRNSPDLYGPFWICATLALALAVGGALSPLTQGRQERYRPHFHNGAVADPPPLAAVGAAGGGHPALGLGAGPHLLASSPQRGPGNRRGRGGHHHRPARPPSRLLQALFLPGATKRQPGPLPGSHGGRGAAQPPAAPPRHQPLAAGQPPPAVKTWGGGGPALDGDPPSQSPPTPYFYAN